MITLPTELRTPRLRLRRPRVEDAPIVFERWTSDPELTRYLTWLTHTDVSETAAWLEGAVRSWEVGEGQRPYLIERDGVEGPIGSIGVTVDGHKAVIGFGLRRASWGQGLMTEAAREVVTRVAALEGIHRVWSVCDVDNHASARVLEKIGMKYEGELMAWVRHPQMGAMPRDVRCYAFPRRTA